MKFEYQISFKWFFSIRTSPEIPDERCTNISAVPCLGDTHNNYSMFIWYSNLTGSPEFLLAKSGSRSPYQASSNHGNKHWCGSRKKLEMNSQGWLAPTAPWGSYQHHLKHPEWPSAETDEMHIYSPFHRWQMERTWLPQGHADLGELDHCARGLPPGIPHSGWQGSVTLLASWICRTRVLRILATFKQ